jgi:hypothetical protein
MNGIRRGDNEGQRESPREFCTLSVPCSQYVLFKEVWATFAPIDNEKFDGEIWASANPFPLHPKQKSRPAGRLSFISQAHTACALPS